MPVEIAFRLVEALALILLGWLSYRLISMAILKRASRQASQPGLVQPGKPAILYFTTPDCVVCKTTQRPALWRLQQITGDLLQVVEIDAYEQPELAKAWGVLSVPTTFILDSQGKPLHVNHGVTTTNKLLQQLPKKNL